MTLVFWQNILSPHLAPFQRALAQGGREVIIVTAEVMTSDRRLLGWNVPDHGPAKIVVAPSLSEADQLVEQSACDAVHIIGGARLSDLGGAVARSCLKYRRRLGILSEAPDPRGLAGRIRWGKYAWEARTVGRHYDFVLAMGEMGVRWFRACGYPAAKVFPFAYSTEESSGLSVPTVSPEEVSLLFVGRLVGLKGVDDLLKAFAGVETSATLTIVGDGPEEGALKNLAVSLRIDDKVSWSGQLPLNQVSRAMEVADVTILPSRKDGWGAVVNESLQVGTPVICSDAAGAADLVNHPWLGTVFSAGKKSELAAALRDWVALGPRSLTERRRIREWAKCISGTEVAHHFESVMTHVYEAAPRPEVPWKEGSNARHGSSPHN